MAVSGNGDDAPLIPPLPARVRGRSPLSVFITSLLAFLRREMMNQFGRSRLGYFWAIAEPGGVVAVLTVLHGVIRGGHGPLYGESPIVFFVFGAVPFFLFANTRGSSQGVLTSQKGLFSYRQIKPVDIMLANSIIDGLTMLGVALVFVLGWMWFGHPQPVADPLHLLNAFSALFVMGFGIGVIFEVFGTVFSDLRRVFGLTMRPMFFISGVFFTIDMIPLGYRHFLLWNPVLHAVDHTRDAVLPAYDSPGSMVYAWSVALILLFLGLAAYRRYLPRLL